MKNSIEEDIKIVGNIFYKGYTMSILHPNTNIKECEIKAIEHILSDYKRVLKENEEYYKQLDLDYTENNFISKQKVKDNLIKYQEEYELLLEHQSGKESNRTKYLRGRIHMCQELLESEE